MAPHLLAMALGSILLVYTIGVDKNETVVTCSHQGETYYLGNSTGSPCHPCLCELTGQMICFNITCWTAQCADAHKDPEACCYMCPHGNNCKHGNDVIRQGETVDLGEQVCSCPSDWFTYKLGTDPEVLIANCTKRDEEDEGGSDEK